MPQALSDSPLVQKIPRGCLLLKKSEVFWRDHQEWLEEKGYVLRPRYQPEWVPSWDVNDNTIRTLDIEDAIPSPVRISFSCNYSFLMPCVACIGSRCDSNTGQYDGSHEASTQPHRKGNWPISRYRASRFPPSQSLCPNIRGA